MAGDPLEGTLCHCAGAGVGVVMDDTSDALPDRAVRDRHTVVVQDRPNHLPAHPESRWIIMASFHDAPRGFTTRMPLGVSSSPLWAL